MCIQFFRPSATGRMEFSARLVLSSNSVQLNPRDPPDGWVLKVGEFLIPMVAAMRRELISESYIQADDTPVDCRHARAGDRITKRIYGNRFLERFEGILQTDGYSAYDQTALLPAHKSRRDASPISWRPTPPSPTGRSKKLAYAFSSNAVSSDGDPAC